MKKKKILSDIFIFLTLISLSIVYAAIFDPYNLALFGYEPHPFLLITVILSSYRGLLFSLLASLFSSVLYLSLIHFQIDYEVVETLFTWSYFSLPTTIFFLSVFVGLIRQTMHDRYKDFVESDKNREIMLENIEQNQKKIEIENRELKERLVTKEDSIQSLYVISQKLSELDKEILFDNFFEVIREHAHVTMAEIFEVQDHKIGPSRGFFGVESSQLTEIENNSLVLSSLKLKKMTSLLDLSQERLDEVSQNNGIKVVLSVPLSFEEQVWGVLLVYDIPFLKYIPTTFKMIDIYCKWLSSSLLRVNAFKKMEEHASFDNEYHIFKNDYYSERLVEEIEQAKSYNIKISILKVKILNWNALSLGKRKLGKKLIIESIRKSSRKMDVISLGQKENEIEILVLGSHDRARSLIEQARQLLQSYHSNLFQFEAFCWDYSGGLVDLSRYHDYFKMLEESE